MITVTVDGDMLVITVGDETTEIPLWLIRSWQDDEQGRAAAEIQDSR